MGDLYVCRASRKPVISDTFVCIYTARPTLPKVPDIIRGFGNPRSMQPHIDPFRLLASRGSYGGCESWPWWPWLGVHGYTVGTDFHNCNCNHKHVPSTVMVKTLYGVALEPRY